MSLAKNVVVWILTLQSRLILSKYKPFIVAVTGSVGKTSTKDAIYDVFKSPMLCIGDHMCYVRKSEKSMNSEIGLPLTIIGAPNAWKSASGWLANIRLGASLIFKKATYPDCLILEIGADHPDDIKNVTRWLKPDIAVITKVSKTPVHVEFFASPEQVFEEKAALAEAVKPGGTVVLFADDEKVMSIAARLKDKTVKIVSFGLSADATVRGSDGKIVYDGESASADLTTQHSHMRSPTGLKFNLSFDGATAEVHVKDIIGNVYMYPLLAAAAAGKARSLAIADIAKSLSAFEAPRGRMNIIPGVNGSTLIDDTYNSSPDAALAALNALKQVEYARTKIAVFGDMMELGKYSADEHRTIGREAAAVLGSTGLLITVGPRSHLTADEALKSGMPATSVMQFDSANEVSGPLSALIQSGDVVLIKGSQSVRMERVVAPLMRHPENAKELLVRQEKEWLQKQ